MKCKYCGGYQDDQQGDRVFICGTILDADGKYWRSLTCKKREKENGDNQGDTGVGAGRGG